jgi:arginine decarboxylase
VYTEKAIEMAGAAVGLTSNGHRSATRKPAPATKKTPKKKPAKSGEVNGDRDLPEVGHDELLGEQQPGDQAVADVGAEELTGEQQPGDAVHADAGP